MEIVTFNDQILISDKQYYYIYHYVNTLILKCSTQNVEFPFKCLILKIRFSINNIIVNCYGIKLVLIEQNGLTLNLSLYNVVEKVTLRLMMRYTLA